MQFKEEAITTLQNEAMMHGDAGMVATCERALSGDRAALARCLEAMQDAEAMDEDDRWKTTA